MSRPELHEGDKDNRDVRLLQQMLRDLNYSVGNIDGDFGPITKAALINYQSDHLIGDTRGVCGANTWAALEAQFGDLDGLRSEESVKERGRSREISEEVVARCRGRPRAPLSPVRRSG